MAVPNLITQETLKGLKGKQTVRGIILCRSYNTANTKNGKEYVTGVLQSGVQIPFKAWDNSTAYSKLKAEEYTNLPVLIDATADDWGGSISLVINDLQAVSDVPMDAFLPVRYDANGYFNALVNLAKTNCSEKAMNILNVVLFENTEVAEKFKIEFAASSHHDNCKTGLLAHTYKVFCTVINQVKMFPNIAPTQDIKDLLYIGTICHDLGKIKEMNLGVYQPCSIVTHRYLGIEMLPKDLIVQGYGENGWLQIVSILLQHHGVYDDKCKTVLAYIVHQADLLDSRMTLLAQSMEQPLSGETGQFVKVDEYRLTI